MSYYEPNQQQGQQPQQQPYGYTSTPAGTEPMANADRWALIGLTVSVFWLISCVPGLNCLAILAPLGLGIFALVQAKNAANPSRARMFGWIATGIGSLVLLGILVVALIYGAAVITALQEIPQP